MKRGMSCVIYLLLFTSIFPIDAKIGLFVHAPMVQIEPQTEKPYGPTVDYITAVIREMGYNPEITVMPLTRILNSLETGTLDLTLEIAKNSEREEFLFFSEKPIYFIEPVLIFTSNNPIKEIRSLEDIKGLKIGYLSGAALPSFSGTARALNSNQSRDRTGYAKTSKNSLPVALTRRSTKPRSRS
jgi:ABC-type amino acid transport substrate-binding protein